MKKNNKIALVVLMLAAAGFLLQSCGKDSKVAYPPSKVMGKITYNGQPVNQWTSNLSLNSGANNNNPLMTFYIRQTAPQPLSLQDNPIFARGDGTFTYATFDGDYTIFPVPYKAPWKNIDPISFTLNGTQNIDIPVEPYFWVSDYQVNWDATDSIFTATFRLDRKVDTYKNNAGNDVVPSINEVRAYFNTTSHVDAGANIVSKAITNTAPNVITVNGMCTVRVDMKRSASWSNAERTALGSIKATTGKLWANIGVRTQGITDHLYQAPVALR